MAKRDFGGAFDIDPYSFWTRDDIDEFTSELADHPDIKAKNVEILKGFIENDDLFEIDVRCDDAEWTVKTKINMRKIKKPSDLQRLYIPVFVDLILKEIDG